MKKKKKNSSPEKENNERFIFEGTIVDPIKDIMFHVRLDNSNRIVLGYLSGKIRRNRIRVLLGDRVKILINEFDTERGKIFYRFPPQSKKSRLKKIKDDHQAMENPTSTESTETTNPIRSDSYKSTDQRNSSKDTTPNQD